MSDPANNDAALVREARMEAKGLRDARPGWKKMADLLVRLAAAAERAEEWEQKAKSRLAAGMEQERLKLAAEAALLAAQQEQERWRLAADLFQKRAERAETTNTRLREALRLATYAFAQYAEERNDPSDEAVEGFMDVFMQDADLRRLASDAEQENA